MNTYTTSNQAGPAVARDVNGNFVVVWNGNYQDGSGFGIFGQRINASGTAQGSEFRLNTYTTGNQIGPAVVSDANANFVVVWQSYLQDGSSYGIFGRRFNAGGVAQGSEFGEHIHHGFQDAPARPASTATSSSSGRAWAKTGAFSASSASASTLRARPREASSA